MKKIKGLICSILMVFLFGCQQSTQTIKVNLEVFTLDTCKGCQAFKKYAQPALEKEFKDEMKITYYDLDKNEQYYKELTSKLIDFDEVYAGKTPLLVVNQKFAVLAYNQGEETELVADIHRLLNNEALGEQLSQGRWLFK